MIYEVELSEQADSDLRGIFEYIAFELQSPENAIGQLDRLEEQILSFERLEYISDTAGEMLFKVFFSMLMITAGILGCVFLVWAGVEQYKKIWDDLYKMVLISSI